MSYWQPKKKTNDIYYNKSVRIYYKDNYCNDNPTKYIEGKLKDIIECKNKQDYYSVIIIPFNGYPITTCTSSIIKRVEVELFDVVHNDIQKIVDKYLVMDIKEEIQNYVDSYVEI